MPAKKNVAPAAIVEAPAATESKLKSVTQTFTVRAAKKHSVQLSMAPGSADTLPFTSVYMNRASFESLGVPAGTDPAKVRITVIVVSTEPAA